MDIRSLLISLSRGISHQNTEPEQSAFINELLYKKIVKLDKFGNYKIDSAFEVGKLDVSLSGTGYLEVFGSEEKKDLIIEPKNLSGATKNDIVVVKKIYYANKPKAKVVFIAQKGFAFYVGITKNTPKGVVVENIKTSIPINVAATQKSLKQLPKNTLLKIESKTSIIKEVIGILDDQKIDEKISLALFDKNEFFTPQSENEAMSHGNEVDKSLYPNRVDLTNLPFCTIDPNDAKDFDDAVYFDEKNFAIYVAIADVSEYVYMFGSIDKEAKKRGFSIYFPHKSIPMLPRTLSENICSLKPNVDRLVFCFKITLDKNTLEPLKEELFEGIINSKKRYSYENVDMLLKNPTNVQDKTDILLLPFLIPLFKLTKKLKEKRLQNSFTFESSEIRMNIDENHLIVSTQIECETPSHSLIEECMLLANKAAAKRINYGIFRTHEPPSYEKIDRLLDDLSLVGIEENFSPNIVNLVKNIQMRAENLGIRQEVDKLIIKSQKQACYTPENKGHFGLGFDKYAHFTSPIRRYSDLMLHRLLKTKIADDERAEKFQLKDIENLCVKLSELERESDKVAYDFMDRKFARWANENINQCFVCKVTEIGKINIAVLDDKLKGARIFLLDSDVELFEKISVRIVESNIMSAKIIGKVSKRL